MAIKKAMLASMIGMASFGTMAAEVNQGQGQIRFIGTIIEAPCSIDQDKTTQEVNFGQVSASFLNSEGKSGPKEVLIELKDCVLSESVDADGNPVSGDESVTVTFSGQDTVADKYLGVSGVDGVGVTMNDWKNSPVEWGVEGPNAHTITAGANTLNYTAYLEKLPTATTVTTGDFVAITNFTLAYE